MSISPFEGVTNQFLQNLTQHKNVCAQNITIKIPSVTTVVNSVLKYHLCCKCFCQHYYTSHWTSGQGTPTTAVIGHKNCWAAPHLLKQPWHAVSAHPIITLTLTLWAYQGELQPTHNPFLNQVAVSCPELWFMMMLCIDNWFFFFIYNLITRFPPIFIHFLYNNRSRQSSLSFDTLMSRSKLYQGLNHWFQIQW